MTARELSPLREHFHTQLGSGLSALFTNLDQANMMKYMRARETLSDKNQPRFMFFRANSGKATASFRLCLFQNIAGEVTAYIGRQLHKPVTGLVSSLKLIDGVLKLSIVGESKPIDLGKADRAYYQEIIDFYNNVFLSKDSKLTRSEYLAWSLHHCKGGAGTIQTLRLSPKFTDAVESMLFGDWNMDFLVSYLDATNDNALIKHMIKIAALRGKGEVFTLVRSLFLLDKDSEPEHFVRDTTPWGRAVLALARLDKKSIRWFTSMLLTGRAIIDKYPAALGVLGNCSMRERFHASVFWSTAALTAARMGLTRGEPWARSGFLSVISQMGILRPLNRDNEKNRAWGHELFAQFRRLSRKTAIANGYVTPKHVYNLKLWTLEAAVTEVTPQAYKDAIDLAKVKKHKEDWIRSFVKSATEAKEGWPATEKVYDRLLGAGIPKWTLMSREYESVRGQPSNFLAERSLWVFMQARKKKLNLGVDLTAKKTSNERMDLLQELVADREHRHRRHYRCYHRGCLD